LIYKERELKTHIQCADLRINDMKELTSLAFKSPVFKKSMTEAKTVPVHIDENGYSRVEYHSETVDKTSEETEE